MTVFNDEYTCPECETTVMVVTDDHRTRVGYTTATVRCMECGQPMERTA